MIRLGPLVLLLFLWVADAGAAETVAHVVDGDTIVLASGERVRLLDIDTAEMDAACPAEWLLARAARGALVARLWLAGWEVTLRRDGVDRYGRTLAVVLVSGEGAGAWLVDLGLARPWTGRREIWCE